MFSCFVLSTTLKTILSFLGVLAKMLGLKNYVKSATAFPHEFPHTFGEFLRGRRVQSFVKLAASLL